MVYCMYMWTSVNENKSETNCFVRPTNNHALLFDTNNMQSSFCVVISRIAHKIDAGIWSIWTFLFFTPPPPPRATRCTDEGEIWRGEIDSRLTLLR